MSNITTGLQSKLMSDEDYAQLHPASKARKEQKQLRETLANAGMSKSASVGNSQEEIIPDADILTDTPPARNTVKEFVFPDKVIMKPISKYKNRLGLEIQKEGFLRMPGVLYKWEPSGIGDSYMTGLDRLSQKQLQELERGIGKVLNFDYYVELTYSMDGSNPNGHHMDLTKPRNKVVYLAMLESHLIAEKLSDYRTGIKPEADWYMENMDAEAEVLSIEKDLFSKVFEGYNGLSNHKKVAIAKILQIQVRGMSPKVADTLLYTKLTSKDPGYQKVWNKFIDICTWSDTKILVHEEVEDALAMNILRRNGAQDFIYGDEILGSTKEQIISKLLQPENGGLRQSIKGKLNNR